MDASEWGLRLRARANELGMTDSDVARRIGMTQRRYSSYVNQAREPNFADLLRICRALSVTPDYVLGVGGLDAWDDTSRRALAALRRIPSAHWRLALAALEGMAALGDGG